MPSRKLRPTLFRNFLSAFGIALLVGPVFTAAGQMGPPMPPQRVVQVYGQNIRYYEAGQGPDLIFIHGLGGEAANWAANIVPVSTRYRVYALDQIGFGHSDKPLIDYRIETFVEFLQAFMQELKIPKATLVGNSLGGWIAVDFAARHPEMVERLVLVDAAGLRAEGGSGQPPLDLNPSSLAGMRRILEFIVFNKQLVTDELARHAFENHLKSGDGYTIQRILAGVFTTHQFEDDKLGSIRTPTPVLWGRDDALTPLSIGERYQKGIPGAKLVVLDQCCHIPQIEKPVEFNAALLNFLAQP